MLSSKEREEVFTQALRKFVTSDKTPLDYMYFIVAANRVLRQGVALSWDQIWNVVCNTVNPGQPVPDIHSTEFLKG